ncbi:MAG TPA: nucleotidyltransferase domain-containing protein [Bryobacteraceae bacterium]|nr:nucleotidyltransferase domain-containing protein [Bryobacteraceae bacterium]
MAPYDLAGTPNDQTGRNPSHCGEAWGAKHPRFWVRRAGRERCASDIDFLVDLEPGRSLFDLSGLLIDLEAVLQTEVDVVTERGLRERIRERVLREAVPL